MTIGEQVVAILTMRLDAYDSGDKAARRTAGQLYRRVTAAWQRQMRGRLITERYAEHAASCDNICRCGELERQAARDRMRAERRAGVRRRLKRRGWC